MIPAVTRVLEITLSHFSNTYHIFKCYYERIVAKEILLGDIKQHERVLCIGGGAFPATAIEINRQTGAKVDVLDCDGVAVKHAVNLLKRMHLDKKINVFCGCGQNFDPKEYEVVHIALQVRDREEILEHLQQHALPGTRILARFPRESMEQFYHKSCGSISQKMLNQSNHLLVNPEKTLKGTCVMVQGGNANENMEKLGPSNGWNPINTGAILADGHYIGNKHI